MNSPAGTATRIAAITEMTESTTCSVVRLMIPEVPVQFAGSPNHAATWLIRSMSGPSSLPAPRRCKPARREDQNVQGDREGDGEDRPDVHRGRVAEAEAAHHHLAQPTLADDRRDHHEP